MTAKRRCQIRGGAIIIGILFMGIGINRGEPATVLMKAINVCLECIGIG